MGISILEYEVLRRRLGEEPSGGGRESDLHCAIMEYCRARGWLALHGSTAHRTRRTLGEPDFIVLLPGGRTLFVECKTATGKLTTEQQAVAAWIRKLGHVFVVVRSLAEFERATETFFSSTT